MDRGTCKFTVKTACPMYIFGTSLQNRAVVLTSLNSVVCMDFSAIRDTCLWIFVRKKKKKTNPISISPKSRSLPLKGPFT